ncbi:MAG: hypothetical protein AAF762_15395 [Pseudomonadota bacterium]
MAENTEKEQDTDEKQRLELINMPWGFRLRPADMKDSALDTATELGLTFLGATMIFCAFGQWLIPGSFIGGNVIAMKLMLMATLGVTGGLILSISARGFRSEVQVDSQRNEIRFVSRNPRGRGEVLATVDIDNIIGVGMTKSLEGSDCHCLIYLLNGQKPLRLASGSEREIRAIRERMDDYVMPASERLASKMARAAAKPHPAAA